MVKKLITPVLRKTEYEYNTGDIQPDINDNFDRVLAHLIGYDRVNEILRFINIDSEGRVYVSSGSVKTDEAVISTQTVGVTAVVLLNPKTTRKSFMIINNSSNTIYVGFADTVTSANGFPIPAGSVWENDHYIGTLYAIADVAGNDVRIMDLG